MLILLIILTAIAVIGYLALKISDDYRAKSVLTKIALSLKNFIGIDTENLSGLTHRDIEILHDYEHLSHYLKPISYDEEHGLYRLEDEHIGFNFIIQLKPGMGYETLKFLESGIYQNPLLPENTIIQWNTWASPFISPLINDYLERKEFESIHAAQMFYDFFTKYKKLPLKEDWQVSIRDFFGFLSIKIPFDFNGITTETEYESAISSIITIKSAVKGVLSQSGVYPTEVNENLYILLLRLLLNPSHDEQDAFNFFNVQDEEIRKQIIYRDTLIRQPFMSNHIEFDKYFGKVLSIKNFPQEFTSADILEYMGSVKHLNRNQINTPFIFSFTARKVTDKEISALKLKAEATMKQKSFSALSRRSAERQEDFIVLNREMEGGQLLWRGMPSFFLYHDNFNFLNSSIRTLKNMLAQQKVELQEEYIPLPFFLGSLPLNVNSKTTEVNLGRAKPMLSYNCVNLTPVQADWKGTGTPTIPFISRRGQLVFVDLWDTNGGMNASVVGPMGQGKSVAVNHIIYNYRSEPNTKIRVIDVGRSYFGITELFHGNFVEPSYTNAFSVNPFSNITNINQDMDYLVNIVDKMVKPTDACDDAERGLLQLAIRQAYEKNKDKLEITHVRDEIIKIAEENHAPDFKRLAIFNLSPWCIGGQYEKFMSGVSKIDLSNRLVTLELGQIKDDTKLTDILILTFFYHINKEIYQGDREIKKLIIWDEAWRFTDNIRVLKFLEQGSREYRKFNGSLIFITQTISDLLKNDVTKVLKNNSEYLFIFWQPPEEWERISEDKELFISEFEKELYRDTLRTVKGEYSEILVMSRSNGRGIVRLVLPKEIYWLYTTDAKEVAIRTKYFEQTGDIFSAIQLCMQNSR